MYEAIFADNKFYQQQNSLAHKLVLYQHNIWIPALKPVAAEPIFNVVQYSTEAICCVIRQTNCNISLTSCNSHTFILNTRF